MKKSYLLCFIACGLLSLSSCSNDGGLQDSTSSTTTNATPTSVKLVVPVGSSYVVVKYKTSDTNVESTKVAINPTPTVTSGRDVSPFTNVTLTISSPNNAYVDIYDDQDNLLVQNKYVAAVNTTSKAVSANVTLPETAVAKYVTADEGQTFYHSSGVAMFDDSWPNDPNSSTNTLDADFNDVVVDYDIEARTVDNVKNNSDNAWREEVKVVMHLRAMGGMFPRKAGLILEGLDNKYITSKEEFITLGNYNNPFNGGNLPTNCTIGKTVDMTGDHPVIEITNLDWLRSSAASNSTYDRNGKTWYMNKFADTPSIKQYDTEKIKNKISDMNKYHFYNTIPGYVNAGGALITVTIVFHYADRSSSSMTEAQRTAQLANMMEGVTNTESQNFYITTTDYSGNNYEIHMKGYQPTASYAAKYTTDSQKGVAKNTATTYCSSEATGYKIWGFKTPVLTRHAWELYPFVDAYPQYLNWVKSQGAQDTEWYKAENANGVYMSCWW